MSGAERPRHARGDEAGVREVKSRLSRGVLTEQSGYWSDTIGYNACGHWGTHPPFVRNLTLYL